MTKGLTLYGLLLILIAVVLGYFILRPSTQTGTVISFTAGQGDWVEASGAEVYYLSGSGVGYFRITSGDTLMDGSPYTGDNFMGEGELVGDRWVVRDGSETDYQVSSGIPITLTLHQSSSDWFLYIFLSLIFCVMLFGMGYVIATD